MAHVIATKKNFEELYRTPEKNPSWTYIMEPTSWENLGTNIFLGPMGQLVFFGLPFQVGPKSWWNALDKERLNQEAQHGPACEVPLLCSS